MTKHFQLSSCWMWFIWGRQICKHPNFWLATSKEVSVKSSHLINPPNMLTWLILILLEASEIHLWRGSKSDLIAFGWAQIRMIVVIILRRKPRIIMLKYIPISWGMCSQVWITTANCTQKCSLTLWFLSLQESHLWKKNLQRRVSPKLRTCLI